MKHPFCPMRNTDRKPVAPEETEYCDTLGDLMQVWIYLNGIKEQAVKVLPQELWKAIKDECDDLFRQASGGRYNICPSIMLGCCK